MLLDLEQPTLADPSLLADGRLQFSLSGQVGRSVVIEASSDLQFWRPISTNIVSGAAMIITDPNPAVLSRRFYRAVQCQ